MKESLSLLYNKRVKIIYPSIGLSGRKDQNLQNAPFLGLGNLEFQRGSVWVNTIGFDDEMDFDLAIYDGVPQLKSLPTNTICASGIIEVGNAGIMIAAGGYKEADLNWPKGLTDVLVVLNAEDATNRTIKSATFYLKYFRKINYGLNIMGLFGK